MQLIRPMKRKLLVTAMMLAVFFLYTGTTTAVLSAGSFYTASIAKVSAVIASLAIWGGIMYLITNTTFLVLESKTAYKHWHKKVALVFILFFTLVGLALWITNPIGYGWLWLASLLLILLCLTLFQWAVNRDNKP